MRLGIMHPGSMGVTVGEAAAGRAEVLWAGEGRSEATRARASEAGFTDAGTFTRFVEASDAIISLVPPSAAESCARHVADAGFTGIYVDANAIAPEKAQRLAGLFPGTAFVDGGVVGPPAVEPGTTRLYLSGAAADPIAEVFAGSVLQPIVLGTEIGSASALKMAYAAYTKGSGALLIAIRAFAEHHGLTDYLMAEWDRSLPGLSNRSDGTLVRSPGKAWRFSGEMLEIAASFRDAGLPEDFHEAAAEVIERIGPERPQADDPADVVRLILGDGGPAQAS